MGFVELGSTEVEDKGDPQCFCGPIILLAGMNG
jgi:hypothetical protein